jgi:hypothetical protein
MPITDFRNLKEHGGASLSELKEFLSNLRGRSPQEVIGIVKTSLLIQSLVIATVATVAFLFVFTVAPYMIWGPQVTERPKKPLPPFANQPATPTPAVAAKADAKSDGTPSSENTAKAVKAMGMDETKTADPKANPLEKDFDKLLDGAK